MSHQGWFKSRLNRIKNSTWLLQKAFKGLEDTSPGLRGSQQPYLLLVSFEKQKER